MVKVAAVQMSMSEDKNVNVEKAEKLTREAASNGANIILLPELFEGLYFCKDMDAKYFSWAQERVGNPLLKRFSNLARELCAVILVS